MRLPRGCGAPGNAALAAHMKRRQVENRELAATNPHEARVAKALRSTPYKWTPQAIWGFRVFDFWCFRIGVAVEVDGLTHDKSYDQTRDNYNYQRSGIVVIRVRNGDQGDLDAALARIRDEVSWNQRRQSLGLKPVKGADK